MLFGDNKQSICKESCIKQDFTPCFAPMGNVMIGNKINYNIIKTTESSDS
jgi:hypothetical protein